MECKEVCSRPVQNHHHHLSDEEETVDALEVIKL